MRALRPLMPGLSAVFGLHEDDVIRMPYALLLQYVEGLEYWTSVISAGAVEQRKGG